MVSHGSPFLLNFFRPGLASHRAVFSRVAGDSQSRLVPLSRGRVVPGLSFLRSLVRQLWWLRNSQSCLQKRGGHPENVWGIFFTAPERSVARVSRAKSRRVGETGIFGRQSPALPGTLSPAAGTRFPRASMQPICDGEHVRIGTDTIAFELFFFDCIFIFLQTFYKHVRR